VNFVPWAPYIPPLQGGLNRSLKLRDWKAAGLEGGVYTVAQGTKFSWWHRGVKPQTREARCKGQAKYFKRNVFKNDLYLNFL
jgi:hypothetical protein